ncbi:hypothetical protein IPJ70_02735 [Candidatus Campbellbacteria bacterium]|nr:MAG: hypothetical protein IPJ70_02735 [Candidatus Campbellbacteria bacterium]
MKSLFGPYNPYIDLVGHLTTTALLLSPIISKLNLTEIFLCVVITYAVDVDHLLNTFICKRILKVPGYNGTITRADKGYTPKILHGIDVALLVGILVALYSTNTVGLALALTLIGHTLWDFIVYPHNASEMFLVTRVWKRFKPGERTYLTGLIFDTKTLKY